MASDGQTLNVAIVHPEMGVGGAERLVAAAAAELSSRGHRVHVFAAAGGAGAALVPPDVVLVSVCPWVPASLFGRLRALFSGLRMALLALWLYVLCSQHFDVLLVDQVSLALPLLRACATRVVFYVHFPDALVAAQQRRAEPRKVGLLGTLAGAASFPLRWAYRRVFDGLEAWGLGHADAVLANSAFTAEAYARALPSVARRLPARVVHPGVCAPPADGPRLDARGRPVLLCVSRFERKKELPLAIDALLEAQRSDKSDEKRPLLVFVGPHDSNDAECVGVVAELRKRAAHADLRCESLFGASISAGGQVAVGRDAWTLPRDTDVLFLFSAPEDLLHAALRAADVLVYTPADEHFGLAPLEAMAAGVPVAARDSGGPRETVVHGKTGLLVPGLGASAGRALGRAARSILDMDAQRRAAMRLCAAEHAASSFSRAAMGARLEAALLRVLSERSPRHDS